jgi:hypothetical protein
VGLIGHWGTSDLWLDKEAFCAGQGRLLEEPGYNALMHEICVGWGYCGCIKDDKPLHVDDFIPESGPISADQFVEWIFLAENLDPAERPKSHWDGLRAAFVKHMGTDVVDATRLKWSV